jgi:hypothetical protein
MRRGFGSSLTLGLRISGWACPLPQHINHGVKATHLEDAPLKNRNLTASGIAQNGQFRTLFGVDVAKIQHHREIADMMHARAARALAHPFWGVRPAAAAPDGGVPTLRPGRRKPAPESEHERNTRPAHRART